MRLSTEELLNELDLHSLDAVEGDEAVVPSTVKTMEEEPEVLPRAPRLYCRHCLDGHSYVCDCGHDHDAHIFTAGCKACDCEGYSQKKQRLA